VLCTVDDWYVHDIEQQGAVTRTPFLAFAEFIAFVSRVCSKIGRALTFARCEPFARTPQTCPFPFPMREIVCQLTRVSLAFVCKKGRDNRWTSSSACRIACECARSATREDVADDDARDLRITKNYVGEGGRERESESIRARHCVSKGGVVCIGSNYKVCFARAVHLCVHKENSY
jgi:hypothetical protein